MADRKIGDSINRIFVEKLGATERSSFVGNQGDIFYDPASTQIFVSDGKTPGGVGLKSPNLENLIDVIGDLPGDGSGLQDLLDALQVLADDKFDKDGGTITGDLIVQPSGTGSPVLEVNSGGVEINTSPTLDNHAATKGYVDTTTIPRKLTKLSPLS